MSNDDLVARLWEEVSWVRLYVDPVPVAADLMTEAAARIEADSSRITELEAQNATLKAAVGEEGRANRMTVMYERAMAENARLREAGNQLAAMVERLRHEICLHPMYDPQVALDDDAYDALEAWAALSWEPNTCKGCGLAYDPAHHVYGERSCCPDCTHLSGEPTPGGES